MSPLQGWISVVVAKQYYYHGLAQYRLGCVARDEKSFGQSIARMQVSSSGIIGGWSRCPIV